MSTRKASILGALFVLGMCAFMLLTSRVKAHEILEGQGVVCDEKAQAEKFAALGMELEALLVLNAEKNVCVMATVRYIYGHEVNRVRSGESMVQVVEILVLQFKMHGDWIIIPAVLQYTLFRVEESPA